MKTCRKCHKDQPEENFSPCRTSSGIYLHPYCKSCKNELERKRRIEKADEIRAKDRIRWVARKREKTREYRKQYYLLHRDKMILQAKENYKKNRALGIPRKKRAPRVLVSWEDTGITHEQYIAYEAVRKRNKEISSSGIRFILRNRARIRPQGENMAHYLELVGATPEFVHEKISSMLTDGMTWENKGGNWHIDHYIPISYFDLRDPIEAKCAFNWRNLRPISASENLKKGSKLPDDYKEFIESLKKSIAGQ